MKKNLSRSEDENIERNKNKRSEIQTFKKDEGEQFEDKLTKTKFKEYDKGGILQVKLNKFIKKGRRIARMIGKRMNEWIFMQFFFSFLLNLVLFSL